MSAAEKPGPSGDRPAATPGADWSEHRYRNLFTECPVSLWEEDITELLAHLERLRAAGVADLGAHLLAHPEEVARCAGLIRVVSVNRATLDLYEAPDKESLLANLAAVFTAEAISVFREIVIAVAAGRRLFECEAVNQTLRGKRLHVGLKWSLLPDREAKPTRVLLTVTDLTQRKRAEEALRESQRTLEAVIETAPT